MRIVAPRSRTSSTRAIASDAFGRHQIEIVRPHESDRARVAHAGPARVQRRRKLVDFAEKAAHERARGLRVQRLRIGKLLDAALIHHRDAIGQLERFFLIVRYKNARHVNAIVQPAQPAAQVAAHARVERTERLVEQQDFGFDRERARERDALALSARKLRGIALRELAELDQLEQLARRAA